MGKISEETRKEIVAKILQGKRHSEVSREFGIGHTTIRAIWLKYAKIGSTVDMNRSGRPVKTTEKDRRLICRISKKSPFMTAREIRHESGMVEKVSIDTVKRVLRNAGLFGRMAAMKPLLNKRQIQKRCQWCKLYSEFGVNDWKNIIFSDESRIERHSMRRRYVRRPLHQRFQPRYTIKTVKYGGFSILVWGAIKGDGSRMLIRCPIRLDSVSYQAVLDNGLKDLLDKNSIFMHDGAPCHRSLSTAKYLESRKICVLSDWPPQSPDLNPIENLWSLLKEKVSRHSPTTSDQLWSITKQEWDSIPDDAIIALYESMTHRIKTMLQCKGQNMKY